MSKVVLDAVGGDHAPTQAIAGVALALEQGYLAPDEVLLTGPEAMVREAAQAAGLPSSVEVVDAPDLLTSTDSPTDALRKKRNNSIAVGMGLVKAGRAGGFVSAGSTGTVVAAATVGLRYLEGIRKACIGAMLCVATNEPEFQSELAAVGAPRRILETLETHRNMSFAGEFDALCEWLRECAR